MRSRGSATGTLEGTVLSVFFLLLCLVFSHPITSTKCFLVSPASGEMKKAIALGIELKIIAQLKPSVLGMCKAG